MHTNEELNQAAMQIILHAGDCRELLGEAVNMVLADAPAADVDAKVHEAKAQIAKAHSLHTDMIQDSIEDDELHTTLLFTHAQDTLMTINSEISLTQQLIALYRKLEEKIHD